MARGRDSKPSEQKFKGFRDSQTTRQKGNRKDTKRWCKGVPGREHIKEWIMRPDTLLPSGNKIAYGSYIFTCTICGREFDYCWPVFIGFTTKRVCKCGHHG